MKNIRAKLLNLMPLLNGKTAVTLEVAAAAGDLEALGGDLDIDLKKHRNRRSVDQNALLWACIGELAKVLGLSNWDTYLHELQLHGKFSYLLVSQKALLDLKKQWREISVVGERTVAGEPFAEVLAFYGSSTYDAEEMGRLLDGVIADMQSQGLQIPVDERTAKLLEGWG